MEEEELRASELYIQRLLAEEQQLLQDESRRREEDERVARLLSNQLNSAAGPQEVTPAQRKKEAVSGFIDRFYSEHERLFAAAEPKAAGPSGVSPSQYLYNRTLWSVCLRPHDVVQWNVVLFSVMGGASALQTVLCAANVLNSLLGLILGHGVGHNQSQITVRLEFRSVTSQVSDVRICLLQSEDVQDHQALPSHLASEIGGNRTSH
ncbi:hypothetical protein F2P81_017772 [Scophthalmus maximus]|uniref:Uncharacterized protein n=1 Tax=Scophthalmus maximus TaxID=52904 RepID=A0A6A4SIT1_SCOMX|nr:hypothetical protein F2P81_017772 [Scophthalmus maximus]